MEYLLLIYICLLSHAFALPREIIDAMFSDAALRACYNHLRDDLGVDENSSVLVAVALVQRTSEAVQMARSCASLTSREEVMALARTAPGTIMKGDGTEAHLRTTDSSTFSRATDNMGMPTPQFTMLGEPVPGIPQTFVTKVTITNTNRVRMHFVADVGTVLLVGTNPIHYQFVVLLRGVEFNVDPGETRQDFVWAMCIDRFGADPANGEPLIVGGILSAAITDTLVSYRDGDPVTRMQTRDAVIRMLNAAIEDATKL